MIDTRPWRYPLPEYEWSLEEVKAAYGSLGIGTAAARLFCDARRELGVPLALIRESILLQEWYRWR